MAFIPEFILRGLYQRKSLKSTPEGTQMTLVNSLAFDVLVKFIPLEFDGTSYPAKKTQVSNGEQTMLGSEMSASNGFKLLKGTPITVLLLGHELTTGDHRIKFEFEAKAVGVLKFEVKDAA